MKTPMQLSPQALCQELVRDDPWRVLVVVLMLNQTTGTQVRRVFPEFFQRWPTPRDLLQADESEVKDVIRSLGFQNRRYERIRRMTEGFVGEWEDVRDLHGVGKYAADSWEIFVEGRIPDGLEDKELVKYSAWACGLGCAGSRLSTSEADGHARSAEGAGTGASDDRQRGVRLSA